MGRPGYQEDMREFGQQFAANAACVEYVVRCRWPDGFVCPKCSGTSAWLHSQRYVFEGRACGRQTLPIAGTIMHRSHVPGQEWFGAACFVATHTPGISALQLQRQFGIGNYRTAWHLLHRLRRGMLNEERTRLAGVIETDETHIGGPAKGKTGRGVAAATHTTLVAGAIEVLTYKDDEGRPRKRAGRVRLQAIQDAGEKSIGTFVRRHIKPSSRIRTDGWRGYSDTALAGYTHTVRIVGAPERAHQRAPHIHRAFSNLKTWLLGTHPGVKPKYLQRYLDEYVFRFNRRRTPMAAFQTLLGISSRKPPLPLHALASPESKT